MNSRRRPSTILSEAIIITLLLLLPLLFWWRLWTPDPADRAAIPEGDFTGQYYPLQLFSARELAAGRLPAWDPYLNAGQPGLADIQTGAFYPLNLLPNLALALLGMPFLEKMLKIQVIVHFMLAGLFTYLFVRHLARRHGARLPHARFAGAVAALSFTYSGYLTSFPVQQITILETAIWLPLVLFFLDRAFDRSRPWPQILLAAVALACALLAGHPQTAMYVVYMTLAYGLFLVVGRRRRFALYLLAAFVLALALAAVQLWPTWQFITYSTRAGLGYEDLSAGFSLVELTHLLYPGYFGGSPQYPGIMTPILAGAAFFLLQARRQVVFWLVVGVAALLLAFGDDTFLYSVTYLLVPGFGAVRDQERIVYLFSFAASVLAGFGALALVQPISRLVRRGFHRYGRGLGWAWVVCLVLTALFYGGYLYYLQQQIADSLFEGALRHHVLLLIILGGSVVVFALRRAGRARGWRIGLTLGLIWLNLFTVNWRFNLADPPPAGEGAFPVTGLVTFLKAQPGTFRISSAGLLPGGPSAGIVYKIEDITGNTPMRLDAFQELEDQVGDWRRWQLLNVQYVLAKRDLSTPGLEQVYEEGKVKVYRVGDPLPRAWVVYQTELVDDGQALAALDAADFDPGETAVVSRSTANLLPALPAGGGPGEAAQVVEARPGRLVLDVAPAQDGLLVVSQPFYPGWRAEVDGKRVPVYEVDYWLQGVLLGAGAQRVELTYSLSLLPAIISLAALGVVIIGGAVLFFNRRRA